MRERSRSESRSGDRSSNASRHYLMCGFGSVGLSKSRRALPVVANTNAGLRKTGAWARAANWTAKRRRTRFGPPFYRMALVIALEEFFGRAQILSDELAKYGQKSGRASALIKLRARWCASRRPGAALTRSLPHRPTVSTATWGNGPRRHSRSKSIQCAPDGTPFAHG